MTGDKITEADLDYLRNIDTRPGPNAGKAIDKSLPPYEAPTPSSADVIEGMREARNLALEEAARIADRHVAADQELQNRAADPQMVTIAILTGKIIARDIRALALPDSKPDQGGA